VVALKGRRSLLCVVLRILLLEAVESIFQAVILGICAQEKKGKDAGEERESASDRTQTFLRARGVYVTCGRASLFKNTGEDRHAEWKICGRSLSVLADGAGTKMCVVINRDRRQKGQQESRKKSPDVERGGGVFSQEDGLFVEEWGVPTFGIPWGSFNGFKAHSLSAWKGIMADKTGQQALGECRGELE